MSFLADIAAMVLVMPKALFPELADKVLGGGADTVGLLFSALGVGGAVAAALGGWMTRVHRHGLAVLAAVAAWALAIIGFGLSPVLWVGLVFLALAGASDLVSAVFRSSILQSAAPDAMRGRLFGLHIVVVTGGPRLADVRAGAVAVMFSPITAVVAGGISCLVALVLLVLRSQPSSGTTPARPSRPSDLGRVRRLAGFEARCARTSSSECGSVVG